MVNSNTVNSNMVNSNTVNLITWLIQKQGNSKLFTIESLNRNPMLFKNFEQTVCTDIGRNNKSCENSVSFIVLSTVYADLT